MSEIDLSRLEGFQWDDANRRKVVRRMQLEEAQAAFLGEPVVFFDPRHSAAEPRWYLMNRVGKRGVFLVFTVRDNKARIISARYMHDKEVKRYAKKNGE